MIFVAVGFLFIYLFIYFPHKYLVLSSLRCWINLTASLCHSRRRAVLDLDQVLIRTQITESQNGLGWKGPQGSRISNPSAGQGHQPPHLLDQAAQGPIQPGLEHLQGWTGHPQPLWAARSSTSPLSW